jgi:hypothetical protein
MTLSRARARQTQALLTSRLAVMAGGRQSPRKPGDKLDTWDAWCHVSSSRAGRRERRYTVADEQPRW